MLDFGMTLKLDMAPARSIALTQQAEQAEERAERLAAQLRALGVDPE